MAKSKTATEKPGAAVADALATQNTFGLSTADWQKLATPLQLALMEAAGLFQGRGRDRALFIVFASSYDTDSNYETLIYAKDAHEALSIFYREHDVHEWSQPPHCYRVPAIDGATSRMVMWHTLEHHYSDPAEYDNGDDTYDDEPEDNE